MKSLSGVSVYGCVALLLIILCGRTVMAVGTNELPKEKVAASLDQSFISKKQDIVKKYEEEAKALELRASELGREIGVELEESLTGGGSDGVGRPEMNASTCLMPRALASPSLIRTTQ